MPTHLPLVPTPRKDLFYPLALHFFKKCILIAQGSFTLVLQVFLYSALIKFTPPPLLTHSLSPCSLKYSTAYVVYIILYSHINGMFQYFSFSNILPALIVPSDRLINTVLFSLSLYICKYIFISNEVL
jgi:hypothetical protein